MTKNVIVTILVFAFGTNGFYRLSFCKSGLEQFGNAYQKII